MPQIIQPAINQKWKIVKEPSENQKDFTAKLITTVPLKHGDIIGSFKETMTKSPAPRYTTVQIGKNEHIELNSDLVYLNHSCDPNVHVDTKNYHMVALKDIPANSELTFFYPSTEWEMSQPFKCWCGAGNCLKTIQGAKYLTKEQVSKFKLNQHILDLLKEREVQKTSK